MPASDAELVVQIARGDRAAFTTLVRRWEMPTHRLAYRITGCSADADEVRQEVFLKLLDGRGRLPCRPERFAGWIYRCTVNAAINIARRRRRIRRAEEYHREAQTKAALPGPSDAAVAADQARRLAEVLARLEPRDRALLALRFEEDRTFREIAAVVGQPLNTVKSRVHRATQRLRRMLGPEAP